MWELQVRAVHIWDAQGAMITVRRGADNHKLGKQGNVMVISSVGREIKLYHARLRECILSQGISCHIWHRRDGHLSQMWRQVTLTDRCPCRLRDSVGAILW